ncbi:hypothetical protein [Stenotrophomonas maltophilia]|uniref:hypothetical protein n=1 Tax=Stenotrophomonas maltophilia TaxID=40324 RepID=UPI0011462F62|nr:hypothetical protein [Stenotrophomonas maltophilia]QGL76095.1 hypothetical protein FEO95_10860 [Stenotrophomonas maltophilia]
MKNSELQIKISTLITWAGLLVLGQLLLTQWSVRAAGNRDVIDYISFAGTVVGMILAILAIVYSYLANASQRSDAEALRSQISSLNEAIGNARASGFQFSNEVNRLEEIREAIAASAASSAATLEASGRLENEIKSLRGEVAKPEASPQRSQSEIGPTAELLADRALPRQTVLYYLAAIEDEGNSDEERDELLGILHSGEKSATRRTFTDGEINGYYWIFYDLSLTNGDSNRDDFFRLLLLRIDEIKQSPLWERESNKVKDAVALVEIKLSKAVNHD